MRILVLYDNESLLPGTTPAHGFSAYIEGDEFDVLFDTGWSGPILLSNAKKLGVDFERLKYIFLSHQHWDHIGGLPDVFDIIKQKVTLVVPSSFTGGFKRELSRYAKLIEVKDAPFEFHRGFLSSGEMSSDIGIKEHALFLDSKRKVLIVGCSHPDVYRMLSRVGDVDILIGGFHGFERIELLGKVVKETIFPCHCSVRKDDILKLYPEKATKCGVGLEVQI